jgi:tRNA dimethylallyltransferase
VWVASVEEAAVKRVGMRELLEAADQGHLVAIVGPTATGKTELAARLAEQVGGEVVGVDSVQVYRRFDIGSGKPTAEDLARAPHHLVGVLAPDEGIDAARYATLANAAIDDIVARGKRAIVCGGTFLWVKALLYGLAEAPAADAEVRARHRAIALASGPGSLHRMLADVDARSAARLHPNDVLRVSRALEVFELTGESLSALQESHAFRGSRHRPYLVARGVAPEELTARITGRVEGWLESGWIDEVWALLADGFGEARAMGSVGYREVAAHVRGELAREALAPSIVRATRVFARRQRTWLNHAEVAWLDGPVGPGG